jgi:hypothetical protein
MLKSFVRPLCALALCSAVPMALAASIETLDAPTHALAHNIFRQLIEINTTDSVGDVSTAGKAM